MRGSSFFMFQLQTVELYRHFHLGNLIYSNISTKHIPLVSVRNKLKQASVVLNSYISSVKYLSFL